ncbi:hypothetical protein N7537_012285 [Penicillium hordei]|uniref:Protein kinase domain-containing protein n=1 Tax=Penicillium hordei TaxID=40994 RepID=A0AAD6GUC7_9EURO|nr:uncharacterized protein N7537_012285 [Penicillium hordei]KAJ5589607.1 hypothetical protein N7537_012285 [Penicillium hordei]
MKSNADNRATRVQPSQVALLLSENKGVSQFSDPKSKSGNFVPSSHPTKSPPSSPPEPGGKVIRGSPRALALQANSRTSSDFNLRNESPWDTYKKHYECDLAGTVIVCVRSSDGRAARAIRQFSSIDCDKILKVLRSTNHKNVASVWECFCTSGSLYTLSEFDPLSLDHIVACKAFPDQQQLAAIMSQFLEGLAHLVAQGFRHTSLDCSSILMNLSGEVKIARVDCCIPWQTSRVQTSDLAPVSRIMMELMQKYAKDDGAVGIDDLERWSACPAAIEFLSAITSASSFEELKKVCEPPSNFALNSLTVFQQPFLTEIRWSPGDLIGLAWFALISARTFYSYTQN